MRDKGMEVKTLDNRPRIEDEDLATYAFLYYELSDDRRYTSGEPIPLTTSEILTFFHANELEGWGEFYRQMKMLDRVWFKVRASTKKSEPEKTATNKVSAAVPRVSKSG